LEAKNLGWSAFEAINVDVHDSQQLETPYEARLPLSLGRRSEAVETQRSLMPPPIYYGPYVQAAAVSRPCHAIGGDFFDYVDTGQEFHVLLGDACGKAHRPLCRPLSYKVFSDGILRGVESGSPVRRRAHPADRRGPPRRNGIRNPRIA
jgi:serine phosphatase RsbU (regulator of sigma subunit)